MGEFFKGWRRKAGLVTLAVACVLMVAWMRSWRVEENIMLRTEGRQHLATLAGGRFYWRSAQLIFLPKDWWWTTTLSEEERHNNEFEIARYREDQDGGFTWFVELWSLVLPLTLLSAWLILGRRARHE